MDAEVDSLHVERIGIDDSVDYVYIVRVDKAWRGSAKYICPDSGITTRNC
jgi:hypothetical protein